MNNETTYTSSVKVMRSHDYCHFEVILGTTEPLTLEGVDAMRKEAARLADKAVAQYKIAKANASKLAQEKNEREYQLRTINRLREKAETERTPEEQASLKAHEDQQWEASRRYDYEDDWPDDYDDQ